MAVLLSDALLSLPNKVYVGNESVIVMQLVKEAFFINYNFVLFLSVNVKKNYYLSEE